MAVKTLIAAGTGAIARSSSTEIKISVDLLPCTLFAPGLAGSEEVDLFISEDDGTTNVLTVGEHGPLTVTKMSVSILTPMHLSVAKDATVASVGVFLSVRGDT